MALTEFLSLLGGVGLFLYGMTVMSTGLRSAAGDRMRDILEKVTGNKLAAVAVGILVTLLIQSSSATDMMVIGFVSAGMMSLSQAIGVILDGEKNLNPPADGCISAADSKVKVLVIPTNEEIAIARDTLELVTK